jgi:hypothetical protein
VGRKSNQYEADMANLGKAA